MSVLLNVIEAGPSVLIQDLGRPGFLVELLIYVALGVLWALPFKFIFKGVGQADPDQDDR